MMKQYLTLLSTAVGLAIVLISGGCATIVGSPTDTVSITAVQQDVQFQIADETGAVIQKHTTPYQVVLAKSDGGYFGGKTYWFTVLHNGQCHTQQVKTYPNGWYLAGNLGFGLFIGWLVVDPLNGDMYSFSDTTVNFVFDQNAKQSDDKKTLKDCPALGGRLNPEGMLFASK